MNRTRKLMLAVLLGTTFTLGGCLTSNPQQMENGNWEVTSRSLSPTKATEQATDEAEDHCASLNKKLKVLEVVSVCSDDLNKRRKVIYTCE